MDLVQLRYFKKVFETKNITKAAAELFITQPALSRSIKKLEKELDVPLFMHVGRNIEPTLFSEEFYQYTINILEEFDKSIQILNSLKNKPLMHSITIMVKVASPSIQNLVTVLKKKYPELNLKIIQHGDYLPDKNELFFCLSSLYQDSMTNHILFTEPILLAIPKIDSLNNNSIINLKDISNRGMIVLSSDFELRRIITEKFKKEHIKLPIGLITDSPTTLRLMIKQGLGLSFVPETTWLFDKDDDIILKSIQNITMKRTIYLSTNLPESNPLVELIIQTLRRFYLS